MKGWRTTHRLHTVGTGLGFVLLMYNLMELYSEDKDRRSL